MSRWVWRLAGLSLTAYLVAVSIRWVAVLIAFALGVALGLHWRR